MSSCKRPPARRSRKRGFGFSSWGMRNLMSLFMSSVSARRSDRRQLRAVFANAIVFGLTLGGAATGVAWFGGIGLVGGAFAGLTLAAAWLERDDFFR